MKISIIANGTLMGLISNFFTKDFVSRVFGEVTPVDQSLLLTHLDWVARMAGMTRCDDQNIQMISRRIDLESSFDLIKILTMLFGEPGDARGGTTT